MFSEFFNKFIVKTSMFEEATDYTLFGKKRKGKGRCYNYGPSGGQRGLEKWNSSIAVDFIQGWEERIPKRKRCGKKNSAAREKSRNVVYLKCRETRPTSLGKLI